MTTDSDSEVPDVVEETGDQKSFFARGALLGLVGGVLVAILVMSVAGSVISLIDDVFGSEGVAEAESAEPMTEEEALLAAGEDLATTSGCVACHSTDGLDGVGPTWQGLSATADAAYVTESILDPNAVIVAGFQPDLMPADYTDKLSEEDLNALVAYILSL